MEEPETQGLEVFTTCPQSKDASQEQYADLVAQVARWSEEAGCRGILVYSDNGLVDPWLVSQLILESTKRLCPLIAVQPVYMHPYTAAKMIASLGFLHGRRIYLNMLAGGFRNDLLALHDETPHDERYARTVEYTTIIKRLLGDDGPVTFDGSYYRVTNLRLTPALPPELHPGILVSGSSPAGLAAARAIGATAVKYPEPPAAEAEAPPEEPSGIRVGIIARERSEAAWAVAHERFPPDRKGQITHGLAMKVSDSHWHRQLSETADSADDPYWLEPFRNSRTFCPYLVGSYERVAEELARYLALGFRTIILDIPASKEEFDHIALVLAHAADAARA